MHMEVDTDRQLIPMSVTNWAILLRVAWDTCWSIQILSQNFPNTNTDILKELPGIKTVYGDETEHSRPQTLAMVLFKQILGQTLSLAVKPPTSHAGVPGLTPGSSFLLPQMLGSSGDNSNSWVPVTHGIEFPAPGFSPGSGPGQCNYLGSKPVDGSSLSLCVCLSVPHLNEQIKFQLGIAVYQVLCQERRRMSALEELRLMGRKDWQFQVSAITSATTHTGHSRGLGEVSVLTQSLMQLIKTRVALCAQPRALSILTTGKTTWQ